MAIPSELKQISENMWELPTSYKEGMRVPARILGSRELLEEMDDAVFDQVSNVATLPGIVGYAYCMPDGHFGYGFPIGGVAATDPAQGGVISPGGIGFDINCGMRLVRTNLTLDDVRPRIKELMDALFENVPAGVGSSGALKISKKEFNYVIEQGARWCVNEGLGWESDLELTEEEGSVADADSSKVSQRAIDRGYKQVGTLGSGNHYLEVQVVPEEGILNVELARRMGLDVPNQIVVMFHCGSRGFGHQVATDYLKCFLKVMESKYDIKIRDRELACAPLESPEGQDYFAAMKCGLNMSFANRQVVLHHVRKTFEDIFGQSAEDLGMEMVYDISHNTAKLETHEVDGRERRLLVHRKGATRAFAPNMPGVPQRYKEIGQPVIIGGSMETGSYLLVGVGTGKTAFFSTAHGSGRTMSRTKARKTWRGEQLQKELEDRGIHVRAVSHAGLAEEAGGAYKNIDKIVESTTHAGLSLRLPGSCLSGTSRGN